MPPAPTSNYTDLDIRDGVIEGGGSVPSQFNFEDLVNAATFSKFHPSYLDGATDKNGIVHDGQFRGYPYASPCPDPTFNINYVTFLYASRIARYHIQITNYNPSRPYDVDFTSSYGLCSVWSDDGAGNIEVDTPMAANKYLGVKFYSGGGCGASSTVWQNVPPMSGVPIMVDPPVISIVGSSCLGSSVNLVASQLSASFFIWSTGAETTGLGQLAVTSPAAYWAWSMSPSGTSVQSNVINVGYC